MDILELHRRAIDQTEAIVRGAQGSDLTLATPCEEWDLRTLLNHLVGGNLRYSALPQGKPLERGPGADLLGDDPVAAYHQSAEAVKSAWSDPALLDRTMQSPFGEVPGRMMATMHVVETVAHGWDVAHTTGQHAQYDPDILQVAWEFSRASLAERPPGMPFAAAVDVPDDLPEVDQLAAFLGRKP